ncbi:MAG: DUF3788 family protein [bacterium]|nr:MAG: DUF3788 family protein [bacterium]
MALSVFDDKKEKPSRKQLHDELGRSSILWEDITKWLSERYHPLDKEWVFSGQNWGWSQRLKQKKRTILYLTPCKKYFHVGFVLGERAVSTALGMDLPEEVIDTIKAAKKYAEGRAVRLEIRYKKHIQTVKYLAEAKMST